MNKTFKFAKETLKLSGLTYVVLLVGSAALVQFGRTSDAFADLFTRVEK